MKKIRLRETLAGVGADGEIVQVADPDWYVLRGFAEPADEPPDAPPLELDEHTDEPVGEPAAAHRETAVSAQAVRRTRRRSSK